MSNSTIIRLWGSYLEFFGCFFSKPEVAPNPLIQWLERSESPLEFIVIGVMWKNPRK